jgi:hypothetical protein
VSAARAGAAVVLAVALATTSACGDGGGKVTSAKAGDVIDARTGTYRGVGLGDRATRVRHAFGKPAHFDPDEGIFPPDADPDAVGGPPVITPPRRTPSASASDHLLRFRGASFLVRSGHVYAVVVTADGARTREGVGVGDALDRVRARYPGARCARAFDADGNPSYPYCEVRLAPDRYALFSNDPVGGVALAEGSMR